MPDIHIINPPTSPEVLDAFYRGELDDVPYWDCAVLASYSPEFAERVAELKKIRMRGFSPNAPRLFPHQERALRWMVNAANTKHPRHIKGGLIELEAGLGKTYLSSFYVLSRPTRNAPALVVAKASIVDVWRGCLSDWFPGARVLEVTSASKEVTSHEVAEADIVLTTYDCVRLTDSRHGFSEAGIVRSVSKTGGTGAVMSINHRTPEQVVEVEVAQGQGCLFAVVWDNIVFDESHSLANRNSKTFRACMGLTSRAYWCLTGTPFRNSYTDIWSQYRIIGYSGLVTEWKSLGAKVMTTHQLLDRSLKMTYRSAGVAMPIKYDHVVRVTLEGKFKEVYGFILGAVEDAVDAYLENHNFACILTLFMRLRQAIISPALIASNDASVEVPGVNLAEASEAAPASALASAATPLGSWILSEESWRQAPKITCTVDLVTKSVAQGHHVVIFSAFKSSLSVISRILEERGIVSVTLTGDSAASERDQISHQFKTDPETKVLLATYSTGGEGLTFTVASVVIYVDEWWTPASKAQAGARSWRVGQTQSVHTFTIYADNTIDTRIREICQGKTAVEHKFSTTVSRKASTSVGFGIEEMRKLFGRA